MRRLKLIFLAAFVLILWQGAVRRLTPLAAGTSLHGAAPITQEPEVLRIAAFNIAGGVWPGDNRLDLSRTAAVMDGFDVIGAEEVHGGGNFDRRDQAHVLGDLLHMPWLFGPSERQWWTDAFGNAVLCKWPIIGWRRIPITTRMDASNRTLLEVTVNWHNHPLTVLITHIDRGKDHDTEIGEVSAAFRDAPLPAILMGDLNTEPGDTGLKKLRSEASILDCITQFAPGKVAGGNYDWIFARGLTCVDAGLKENQASDHPMAWAELK